MKLILIMPCAECKIKVYCMHIQEQQLSACSKEVDRNFLEDRRKK